MYCTYCGKQIEDDSVFCKYCGKPAPQGDALAELVAAARIGDQDAISALYEKTYSRVYYTVKSMIKDEDAVLDIVQDTYIKAFAHLDSFQGDTKFLPWVRQIAANTARDWLKKKRPMLFTELSSGDEQDTSVEELFPDERSENLPDQVIDQEETKRLIREIIEELPEDQRAAIGMFYYEEMSVKEIAAAMGVSESAVKSRLMYGRNRIEKKVLELEKQGTKLYSLSPIPFLLLLFRSQKAHAAEAPDSRILQAILASQPKGDAAATEAARSAGTAGEAAGAEAAGAAVAGAAIAAGGLGALKIGLIALAVVAVVGFGILGVTRIVSRSAESQEATTIEEVIDQEESALNDEAAEESSLIDETSEESAPIDEAAEESTPIDEALEQYRTIISQADSYDYGEYAEANQPWLELAGYRYALVQMQPDDPVPTLLLEREIMDTELSVSQYYARVFQYDPDTKTVHQPAEAIVDGGIRGGLSMAGDGYGIMSTSWSGGTGEGSVIRITLGGDSLNQDIYWTGQIFEMPDSITFIDIEWHEIGDLSELDSWTASDTGEAVPSDSGTLPTDGDRIVLTGTVGTYDYDEIVALQGQPDPNAPYEDESALEYIRSTTYRVIVLDTPQTLRLRSSGDGDEHYFFSEALMIDLYYADGMEQYEGQHITFSIDPANTYWPSSADLPFGQPFSSDIHILD
ncbi:MAG: sigma-70 family RNA polymerase sigma factor [Lachnospiraceae bacterium]|nr:sigma-70 family RNA polymerase sigma factor [Lachnospiraceae bacterium]